MTTKKKTKSQEIITPDVAAGLADAPALQVETIPPPPPEETIPGTGGLVAPSMEELEEQSTPEEEQKQRAADEHLAKVGAGMFVMANDVMVSRIFPGDPLRPEEKKQLQEVTEELIAFYGDGAFPPWLAVWIQFAFAMGLIYGVRYAADTDKEGPTPGASVGGGGDGENNYAEEFTKGPGTTIPGGPDFHP